MEEIDTPTREQADNATSSPSISRSIFLVAALIALPWVIYVVLEMRATFFTECPPPLDVVPWALAVSIIVLLVCVAAIALVAGAITGRKPAQRSPNSVGGWAVATAAALHPAAIAFVWMVSLRATDCLAALV